MVSFEDFRCLRSGNAVGVYDAVRAEVVVVREVSVVAAVGEEFELAFWGGEVGEVEVDDGLGRGVCIGAGVDGLVVDGDGFNLAVEGAVPVLCIASDADVVGRVFDAALVIL